MYDVTDEIKNAYKSAGTIKASAAFISMGLTLSKEIMDESPKLVESIMNGSDLTFGACVASQLDFSVKNVSRNIKGQEFVYSHSVNGKPVQIGIYKVESCQTKDNGLKEVTAYDRMKKIDIDVAAWYNGLFPLGSETYTLAAFRASLLKYIGLEEDVSTLPLPNDSMKVEKTIEPSGLSGRKVIEACEALNGAFGHINRYGKFAHIVLKLTYGLYPSKVLYPSGSLYPSVENDTSYFSESAETLTRSMYRQNGVKFEEYVVKEFDKLIIRTDENDIGTIVGTGSNAYIIEDNFLIYGKSSDKLQTIAKNAFGNINKRPYRPFGSDNIGLPYIEVGDAVKLETDNPVVSYVLNRTLTGIQALKDAFSADGSEEVTQNFSVRNEIIQLQGKSMSIQKSVDGLFVTVMDLSANTQSQLKQTASQISAEVSRAKGKEDELSGEVDLLAGQVVLKVTASGKVALVDLNADPSTGTVIKLSSDNINMEGYVTITSLKTPGIVEIDGGNLKAGTVIADSVRADWVYAGGINADQITAGTISGDRINGGTISGVRITGATLVSQGEHTNTKIENGFITLSSANGYSYYYPEYIRMFMGNDKKIDISYTGGIRCENLTVGGYAPITTNTIQYQAVASANVATYAATAGSANTTSSCTTGFLTLSAGTLVAPAGSLWIGQNTVKANTIEQISSIRLKRDIKRYKHNALNKIRSTVIKTYGYKNENKKHKRHLGIIVEEAPKEIIGSDGDTIDIYAMTSLAWKAIQELSDQVERNR